MTAARDPTIGSQAATFRMRPSAVATDACPVFFDIALQLVDAQGKPSGALQRIVMRSNEGTISGSGQPQGAELRFAIPIGPTGSPSRDALLAALTIKTVGTVR